MFNQIKESFRVLGKENKNKVFKIFLIISFAVFFDILSIGLILPILTLFFDEEKFENYEILQNIKYYFNIDANLIIISLSLFF